MAHRSDLTEDGSRNGRARERRIRERERERRFGERERRFGEHVLERERDV